MICVHSTVKHHKNMGYISNELKKHYEIRIIKKQIINELVYNFCLQNTIKQNHYIIRIGDGKNFTRKPYKVWGFLNHFKSRINKFKKSDVIWFMANKNNGGIIEVAEFKHCFDRHDDLLGIDTYTNTQQKWEGNKDWNIQMHYNTIKQTNDKKFKSIFIQGALNIWNYNIKLKEKLKKQFDIDLHNEYAAIKTQQYFKNG